MRVGSFAVARPNYYDRNASGVSGQYSNDLAPHATTTRFTSTCPAGKKYITEGWYLSSWRISAATAVGSVENFLTFQTASGGGRIIEAQYVNNTLYYREVYSGGTNITLYPSDYIVFTTADGSTGGQIRISCNVKFTSFDV